MKIIYLRIVQVSNGFLIYDEKPNSQYTSDWLVGARIAKDTQEVLAGVEAMLNAPEEIKNDKA